MNVKRHAFLVLCLVWLSALPCLAGEREPVAFVTLIKEGAEKQLAASMADVQMPQKQLAAHGLYDAQFFTEKLGDKRVLVCTFDLEEGKQPEELWQSAQQDAALKPWWTKLAASLTAHPRAADEGSLWVHCETICKLRPYVAPALMGDKPSWHAGVTGLKKEKEAEYRLLHNRVWPGVVDAIGDAAISRFDIFLIELDDQVYLFDLFQFVGKDLATDTGRMGKNPVNKRWWAITDPCQQPLPSAAARKEIWEPMEPVQELAK